MLLAVVLAVPATVAVLAAGPGPVAAATPDEWGFAFMDDPTPVAGQPLDATRSWGSWKATWPLDPVRVWHSGLGLYQVRFPHIASKHGVAHVTAVAGDARWCQIVAVRPVASDLDVYVRCYRHKEGTEPTRFAVMYSSASGLPLTSGAYAYVSSDPFGGIINSYNSSGGVNAAGAGGPGEYKVWLPDVTASASDFIGGVQVTAEHPNSPRRCKVGDWSVEPSGVTVLVNCYDQAGMPADSWFNLSYQHKRSIFGGLNPPDNLAYLWSPGLGGDTDYNSQGGTNTVSVSGPGQYLVTFPLVGIRETHVQATAFGPGAGYCNLQEVWAVLKDEVVVRNVICFDTSGVQAANRFFVTYTSRV